MGRAKVEMKYIEEKGTRWTTYRKRSTGWLKKGSELPILTGAVVYAVIIPEDVVSVYRRYKNGELALGGVKSALAKLKAEQQRANNDCDDDDDGDDEWEDVSSSSSDNDDDEEMSSSASTVSSSSSSGSSKGHHRQNRVVQHRPYLDHEIPIVFSTLDDTDELADMMHFTRESIGYNITSGAEAMLRIALDTSNGGNIKEETTSIKAKPQQSQPPQSQPKEKKQQTKKKKKKEQTEPTAKTVTDVKHKKRPRAAIAAEEEEEEEEVVEKSSAEPTVGIVASQSNQPRQQQVRKRPKIQQQQQQQQQQQYIPGTLVDINTLNLLEEYNSIMSQYGPEVAQSLLVAAMQQAQTAPSTPAPKRLRT